MWPDGSQIRRRVKHGCSLSLSCPFSGITGCPLIALLLNERSNEGPRISTSINIFQYGSRGNLPKEKSKRGFCIYIFVLISF